jgi:dephospho-CoA kinase
VIVVGLTGGIGSGKSTVSALLVERGAVLVDADAITKELQRPGQPVLAAIVERFGDGVLTESGELDRPALAGIVFSDPDALKDLNALVHPAVGVEIARRLEAERDTDHVVVLDIPLLVEGGRYRVSGLLVVDVDEEVAVDRLVRYRGFDPDDARARMARQATRDERRAKADRVIDNSGDLEHLRRQVDEAWAWMQGLAPAADPEAEPDTPATRPS